VTINVKSGIASDVSAFEGRVVSSDFAKIVAFIASFKGNSMTSYEGVSTAWTLEVIRSQQYYGYAENVTGDWTGYLKSNKDKNYYRYKLANDGAGNPSATATDLTVYPGIYSEAAMANYYGFRRPEMGADGLVEKIKADGSSDGIFLDVSTDVKKGLASDFLNQFGFYNFDDVKSAISKTIASVQIVATKDADGNVTRIDLNCLDADNAQVWVAAAFNVGSSKIQVVEDYMNGDVVPDPVDNTKLKDALKNITSKKSVTVDGSLFPMDPSTGGIYTGNAQLFTYGYYSYSQLQMDADQYYNIEYGVNTTTGESTGAAKGIVALQKIDGVYNQLVADTQTVSSVTSLTGDFTSTPASKITDIWTSLNPVLCTDALLDAVSYTGQSTDASTGAITWTFDNTDTAGAALMGAVVGSLPSLHYDLATTLKDDLDKGYFYNQLTVDTTGNVSLVAFENYDTFLWWIEADYSAIGSTVATKVDASKIHSSVASSSSGTSAAAGIHDRATHRA
jgi:hypothetical protein